MLSSCFNRFNSVPFLLLTRQYLCKSKNFNRGTPCCHTRRNFSLNRLSEDGIKYFKNRNLAHFVNRVIDDNVASNIPTFSYSSRKQGNLSILIEQFNSAKNNISSLKELQKGAHDDPDFFKSVLGEIAMHKKILGDLEDEILNELLSDEDEYISDIIMEISAGVGGQEAMLFAKELHDLYCNYFNFCNWLYELANFEETEIGGIRQSVMMVSAKKCYKILGIEAGVHRVQRIPATEKYSRLQTSTVSITVYPQPSEVDIDIPESDLRIETKTARGPGGQHVNKIQTAVRLHHLPTGIIIECQTHRSQTQNRTLAMNRLRSKLLQLECEKRDSKIEISRKLQMGSKGRNEKIRTYNFIHDRITDHRFHISCNNIERYLDGGSYFHNFMEQIHEAQSQKRREEFLRAIETVE